MARMLKVLLSCVLLLALVASACGSDDDEAGDNGDSAAPEPAEEPADEPAEPADEPAEPADEPAEPADEPADDEPADDDEMAAECTADLAGGSLTMGTFSQPPGLDPTVANGAASTGGNEILAFYDALLRFDAETGEFSPHVAESVVPSEDFGTWTVTLRPGITFGNGDPLDAAAVKASFERFGGETVRVPVRSLTALAAEVNVIDDLTVEFVLSQPWANFQSILSAGPGMIVNVAVVEERGEDFALNPAGAGVGPFEFEDFVVGERITLVAKDDYWGGPVCIEELTFVPTATATAAYESFIQDEFDVTFLRDPNTLARAADDGFTGLSEFQNVSDSLVINQGVRDSDPITADVRLRRAMHHAVDLDQVNQRAFDGVATMTTAIFSERSRFYQGVEPLPYDPDEARALVQAVKDETGWDGTLGLICETDREELAIALKAQFDAVGFNIELDIVPTIGDLIQKVIVDADFEVSCFGANILDSEPWPGLSNFVSGRPSNYGGHSNPDYDALIDQYRLTPDFEGQVEVLGEIQRAWNDSAPMLALTHTPQTTLVHDNVHGVSLTTNALLFFDNAYLDG